MKITFTNKEQNTIREENTSENKETIAILAGPLFIARVAQQAQNMIRMEREQLAREVACDQGHGEYDEQGHWYSDEAPYARQIYTRVGNAQWSSPESIARGKMRAARYAGEEIYRDLKGWCAKKEVAWATMRTIQEVRGLHLDAVYKEEQDMLRRAELVRLL